MRPFDLVLGVGAMCAAVSCIPPEFTNGTKLHNTGGADANAGAGGTDVGADGATESGGTSDGAGGVASMSGGTSGASAGGASAGGAGAGGLSSGGAGAGGSSSGGVSAGGSPPDAAMPGTGGTPSSCNVAAQCPAPGTVCQIAACLGHQCGFVAMPSATPPGNVSGDCHKIVCSGSGTETVLVDPSDTDDGNECTADSCANGVASHKAMVGARCQNGTKYCDANGACVECLMDGNCPTGTGECSKESCVQGTCVLPASGTFCNNGQDQCDGQGTCADCVDNRGCGGCCFCSAPFCLQG